MAASAVSVHPGAAQWRYVVCNYMKNRQIKYAYLMQYCICEGDGNLRPAEPLTELGTGRKRVIKEP